MNHFFYDLFVPIFYSLIICLAAFCLGLFLLKRIKIINKINLLSVGISVLLGYGILGYFSVVWTFFAPLNNAIISILIILILILGRKSILLFFIKIKSAFAKWKNFDFKDKLFFLIIFSLFLFYFTSAFVPPYQTDAIGYHLPETREIAQNGVMSLSVVGNLYGTSPIIMESLYALMYILSGYTLINLVHYQLLLVGLMVLYYFCKEKFGKLSAQISIVLIFSLYEIFVNATSAYVDAAMASYQIASIILIMIWSETKDRNLLMGAGLLYGLALSIKYLSMYALILILPFIIYKSFTENKDIKNPVKDFLYFVIPTFLFSGFWYIKNLIFFGNPFYPFIFSHPGFTNDQIEMSKAAIGEFRPRTIKNFLLFPFNLFKDKYYITNLVAFLFLPIGFLWINKDKIFKYFLFFVFGYFTIWFFLISHQKRFAMVGLLLLMVCFGYILSKIYYRYKKIFDNKVVKILLITIILIGAGAVFTAKNGYFFKVKKAELAYDLGISDKGQFYSERGLGNIYYLSNYINNNYKNTKFLPIWSDDTDSFLNNGNAFISLYAYFSVRNEFDVETLKQYLKENNVSFVVDFTQIAQDKIMKEWYNSDNPSANDYRDKVIVKILKISKLIPEIGNVIYNDHERLIYAVK